MYINRICSGWETGSLEGSALMWAVEGVEGSINGVSKEEGLGTWKVERVCGGFVGLGTCLGCWGAGYGFIGCVQRRVRGFSQQLPTRSQIQSSKPSSPFPSQQTLPSSLPSAAAVSTLNSSSGTTSAHTPTSTAPWQASPSTIVTGKYGLNPRPRRDLGRRQRRRRA